MAVPVAKGNHGVCTTDAERLSVSKTYKAAIGSSTASQSASAVKSITKNLRLAYSTAGNSGTYDTCFVVAAQL